jgi:hypothetical protein
MKSHGELTANLADKISRIWHGRGYEVLHDHGRLNNNVGKIVSASKKDYRNGDELRQLDIAVVKHGSNQVIALIEIEETTDNPKTFLGDNFGVLLGEIVCFSKETNYLLGTIPLLSW